MMAMKVIALMIVTAKAAGADWWDGLERKLGDGDFGWHDCKQPSIDATLLSPNVTNDTQVLLVFDTQIRVIPQRAFHGLPDLTRLSITYNGVLNTICESAFASHPELDYIKISDNYKLHSIEAFAFNGLPELTEIRIDWSVNLTFIHPNAFRDLVKLRYLFIERTMVSVIPDFTMIHSIATGSVLGMYENHNIKTVPANAFRGLCNETMTVIRLNSNGITEVASHAFNGTKMYRVKLRGNKQLTEIHPDAFAGSSDMVSLDVSETAVTSLPVSIASSIQWLEAEYAFDLRELPPPQLFTQLREASLTYASHCCALRNVTRKSYMARSGWRACHYLVNQEEPDYYQYCSNHTTIICTPNPDVSNPC